MYDSNNIFAKIIRGEIPCNKVYEDAHTLAFHDIAPQAPLHILVIPKGPYRHFADFSEKATSEEMIAFMKALGHIARDNHLEAPGFRLITNNGRDGGQEVPHFHVHLVGGKPLGPMLGQ